MYLWRFVYDRYSHMCKVTNDTYLWRFVYGMYGHMALLILVAIQDSTTLDGEGQS